MDAHAQLDEGGEGHEGEDGGEGHMVGEVECVTLTALILDHAVAGPKGRGSSSIIIINHHHQYHHCHHHLVIIINVIILVIILVNVVIIVIVFIIVIVVIVVVVIIVNNIVMINVAELKMFNFDSGFTFFLYFSFYFWQDVQIIRCLISNVYLPIQTFSMAGTVGVARHSKHHKKVATVDLNKFCISGVNFYSTTGISSCCLKGK